MAQIIDKVVVSDRLAEVGEGLFIYPSFDLENAEIFQYYYTPPPPVLYYYDDFSTYNTGSYIFVCNGGVWDESLFYFTSNAVARDFITCESLDTGSLNGQYVKNWTSGSIFIASPTDRVNVVSRTIDGQEDYRISFSASQFARPLPFGSEWKYLRIAMRLSMTDALDTLYTKNRIAIGLSCGTASLFGDASTTHWYGLTNMTHNTDFYGNPIPNYIRRRQCHSGSISTDLIDNYQYDFVFVQAKKIGTTLTEASKRTILFGDETYGCQVGIMPVSESKLATSGSRTWFSFEISKIDNVVHFENVTSKAYVHYGDVSTYEFYDRCVDYNRTNALYSPYFLMDYYNYFDTSFAVSIYDSRSLDTNVSQSGQLDTLNIYWENDLSTIEISDIAIMKFS